MARQILQKIGYLFYMVDPYDTMFEKVSDIPTPGYVVQVIPYFIGMVILENILRYKKGLKTARFNDGIMSMSHGIIMKAYDFVDKGFRLAIYCYVYEHYCMISLPWDSLRTWIVAAVLEDFFYYWGHRACHEINIFWAFHQVHHSSEDYNLTTALRQSALQRIPSFLVSLPMALVVPPPAMLVHSAFNLLYQFWIHTEVIGDLGPLEYILNTSNHHRVHHGSNRYCLDKNYAGVLIIWDRMFGTFEKYRPEEEIVYGLVGQPQFFNPLKHQLFYIKSVFDKAFGMKTLGDKVSSFLKGPGWFPGTERLGDLNMVPEIPKRDIYDPSCGLTSKFYVAIHFIVSLFILTKFDHMSHWTAILMTIFLTWTLTSLGLILDNNQSAWMSEVARLAFIPLVFYQPMAQIGTFPHAITETLYGSSFIFASLKMFQSKPLFFEHSSAQEIKKNK